MLWRNVNYSYVKARPDLPILSVKTITTCKRFSRNIQKIQGYVMHSVCSTQQYQSVPLFLQMTHILNFFFQKTSEFISVFSVTKLSIMFLTLC